MKQVTWGLFLLVVCSASHAQPPKTTTLKFVEVKPREVPFAVFRVNGMISGLRNARAADVIATFYPMHPVIGRENLADDRRFDIDLSPYDTTSDALLNALSKALGISLRDLEVTTEFLIIRNETNPIPKGWVRVTEQDLLDFGLMAKGPHGITNIDPADGYYTAYFITMPEFAHFLGEHTAKPVWNQTALLGRHCFSFRLHAGNINRTLGDMGFDVVIRQGTTRCVVAAPLLRRAK